MTKQVEKQKYYFIKGFSLFPERRAIKPTGRITLFGKQLTLKQTKNYLKSL